MRQLSATVSKEKPDCVITVGDVVSRNVLEADIGVRMVVVDNKVMRESSRPIKAMMTKTITVQNPAGTLTPETWLAVKQALRQEQPTQLVVEGEEDLLTLVAVLEAPKNSLVIYGQPKEGVVVVKVNEAARKKVEEIIEAMQPLPKS